MKYIAFFILIVLIIACKSVENKNNETKHFYVGTYTNGESEGIYKYQIDENGKLSKIGLVAKANNPSFLAKTKDNKTLLSVEETDENGTGFVKSFKIQKDSLVFVSKSKSGGAHPCFITVNDKNQVLVANYSGGNVGYLKVDDQNGLTNLLSVQQHKGKGTTDRQKAPHAHSTWFHPNKNEIISVDLGTNELWFSTIEDAKNEFTFTNQKKLKFTDGAGPRHLTFHPNKKWIYVLNELNNSVALVKEKEGKYVVETSISMLPKGYSKYSKGADIHISNDGKFLYASNRGHNSIIVYKVNSKNGILKLVDFEAVNGANPRNFTLTPNNKYLLVANQDTNNIISFKRNSETGKLTFVDEVNAPNPVCILF
ncbi:lactonase family protein [Polaribacter porphyrae]|uniref:6-phosphogluconolactonase n=1 Tax=Polaribacter porphyrae TaxID=1137780 RepID=A0A2S7WLW2_9FLAO|nr:lactonase family protein [Polaribacter porphyrae]PQJ78594.1 6-phosphogluconolactonase [Polaribacter porphyrae]